MHTGRWARALAITWLLCLTSTLATAADAPGANARGADAPWTFLTRFVMTGSSDESEPEGVTVYSALTLEGALSRALGGDFAAELRLRSESREVTQDIGLDKDEPLGSLEILPVTLTFQYRPERRGRWHPYAGVGFDVAVAWEKSGALDSDDVETHVGPAIQIGADLDLSATALLNFDISWNSYTAKIERSGDPLADVNVDPLSLGAGIGFRF